MKIKKKNNNKEEKKEVTNIANEEQNPLIKEHETLSLYGTTYDLNMLDNNDCKTATDIHPLNIVKTNKKYRKNPKNYIDLIKIDPYVLFDAPEEIRDDEELVDLAKQRDIWLARVASDRLYGLDSFQKELTTNSDIKKWERLLLTENEKEHLVNVIDRILARDVTSSIEDIQDTKNVVKQTASETNKNNKDKILEEFERLKAARRREATSDGPVDKGKTDTINEKQNKSNTNILNKFVANKEEREEKHEIKKEKEVIDAKKEKQTEYINFFYDSTDDDMEMLYSDEKETDENIEKILKDWI